MKPSNASISCIRVEDVCLSLFFLLILVPSILQAQKFNLGDRVYVSSGPLNVRATPSLSGAILGTQATNAQGTVLRGPSVADGYSWWNISYDINPDGWSVENYLAKVSNTPPAPVPIFPCNIAFDLFAPVPITFTWSSSQGARTYQFQLLPQAISFALIEQITTTNTISLLLPSSASGSYCWRVMAIDSAGRTSAWSSQGCFTVGYWSNLQNFLVTDKTTYSQGETVNLMLSVFNIGSDTIRLNFPTTQQYDFTASVSGAQMWKWSQGMFFAQILTGRSIAPRERVLYRATWNQKSNSGSQVPPGSYVMQGLLTNTPPPLVSSASTAITISPATDVRDEELLPRELTLHQNYPNPRLPLSVQLGRAGLQPLHHNQLSASNEERCEALDL